MTQIWLTLPLFLVGCQVPAVPPASPSSAQLAPTPSELPPAVAPVVGSAGQSQPPQEGVNEAMEPAAVAPEVDTLPPGYPLTFHGDRWLGGEFVRRSGRLMLRAVHRGSPLERAGARAGDVLVRLGGQGPATFFDLDAHVRGLPANKPLPLVVLRAGQTRLFSLTLERKPDPETLLKRLFVGRKAPELRGLQTLGTGVSVRSLADLQGKVVVLEFWATWCVACRAITPTFNHWSSALKVYGAEFLAVTEEPYDVATVGFEQLGYKYRGYVDPGGRTSLAFRAKALPTVFVLDKRGTVVELVQGYSPEKMDRLRAALVGLLGEIPFESL